MLINFVIYNPKNQLTIEPNILPRLAKKMSKNWEYFSNRKRVVNDVFKLDKNFKWESIISKDCILNGNITIGENSIVAAGSLVLKDVEKNSTVAGVPAKELKIK